MKWIISLFALNLLVAAERPAAGIYLISGDHAEAVALPLPGEGFPLHGRRHAVFTGYIKNPGVYYFDEKIDLRVLIRIVGVVDNGYYEAGYASDLSKVRIIRSGTSGDAIDCRYYDLMRVSQTPKAIWLSGGEIIDVPWKMGPPFRRKKK